MGANKAGKVYASLIMAAALAAGSNVEQTARSNARHIRIPAKARREHERRKRRRKMAKASRRANR